jgi:hypothetical protein
MVCVAVLVVSLCILLAFFIQAFNRIADRGVDFSPYRSSISVIESSMSDGKTNEYGTPRIFVVGLITNESDIAWKNIEFELRFFDRSGALIDSGTMNDYYGILSHRDLGFRIWLDPVLPLTNYDSYKIYIGSAKDARSRLN